MARSSLAALSIVALLVAGCATTQPAEPPTPAKVTVASTDTARSAKLEGIEISRFFKPGCLRVGQLRVTCNSRALLETAIREDAASMGANYVHVTAVKVGMFSGKAKARGIALRCPGSATADTGAGVAPEDPVSIEQELEDMPSSASIGDDLGEVSPTHAMLYDDGGALP